MDRGSDPSKATRDFSILQNVQTGSAARQSVLEFFSGLGNAVGA
jgi:hypothetical protein